MHESPGSYSALSKYTQCPLAYYLGTVRGLKEYDQGGRLTSADEARLRRWLAFMDETGTVLHYEPEGDPDA